MGIGELNLKSFDNNHLNPDEWDKLLNDLQL